VTAGETKGRPRSRPRRWFAASLGALVLLLAAACGDGDVETPGVLADRILRLGEASETVVDVRIGEVPFGFSEALNAGMAPGTPDEDLITLHVYRPADLVGSFRIAREDGVQSFWLVYDHAEDAITVEAALLQRLDETPWQVVAGQSTGAESGVRFQSTVSGDIDGTAIVHPVRSAEDEGGALTNVVYIIEVQPAELAEPSKFVLPAPRPIPDEFPAQFLLLDGTIPITVFWGSSAAGTTYQMVLLSSESAFVLAEQYRNVLASQGWELTSDRAIGFAKQLDFQMDDGTLQGTIITDTFDQDDDYASIVLELQVVPADTN
jgi:hypothetical protein